VAMIFGDTLRSLSLQLDAFSAVETAEISRQLKADRASKSLPNPFVG